MCLYCTVFARWDDAGNTNVTYAIVRRKELFERINSLTLPNAIKVHTGTFLVSYYIWTLICPVYVCVWCGVCTAQGAADHAHKVKPSSGSSGSSEGGVAATSDKDFPQGDPTTSPTVCKHLSLYD